MSPVLSLDQYQQAARRTAAPVYDAQGVLILALGLAGESGEVCELLKKHHGHKKPFSREQLRGELGDVLWYLANLADAHGLTLSEVAQDNVSKLESRYPEGFVQGGGVR